MEKTSDPPCDQIDREPLSNQVSELTAACIEIERLISHQSEENPEEAKQPTVEVPTVIRPSNSDEAKQTRVQLTAAQPKVNNFMLQVPKQEVVKVDPDRPPVCQGDIKKYENHLASKGKLTQEELEVVRAK